MYIFFILDCVQLSNSHEVETEILTIGIFVIN